MTELKYYKTGYGDDEQSLVYAKVEGTQVGRYKKGRRLKPRQVSFWSFFHKREDGSISRVGPTYPSKDALLSDLKRYCEDFGF